MSVKAASLRDRVKELAYEAGFDLVSIGSAAPLLEERSRYLAWIESGRHAEMRWIDESHAERSTSPGNVLEGANSVISVGLSYWGGPRKPDASRHGRIARYAWGDDYHTVLGKMLHVLSRSLSQKFGGKHKWYVDTGPLMDKALGARSGLGFYGKNTNLLTERFGSFVLLGEIVTTLPIESDHPVGKDCGSCRLCLVACPTGALGPEYSIDSGKCISYLTIEHRGPIPRDLRSLMGPWVFGCDICQDVCPPSVLPHLRSKAERLAWAGEVRAQVKAEASAAGETSGSSNGASPSPATDAASPLVRQSPLQSVDLLWLLKMTHDEYLSAFRGTSIRRAKDWMLRRNAAIALGNIAEPVALSDLLEAMREDGNPIVRGHAAWAVGRLAQRHGLLNALTELTESLELEDDPMVKEEIEAARTDLATALTESARHSSSALTGAG